MAIVIKNPTTPYVGPIPVGMTEGATIHVRGTTELHHSGFLISLQCGSSTDPRSDCALAFTPRFSEQQAGRNSLQNGCWGLEESHGSVTFRLGENVDMSIVVHAGYYTVMVNGRHVCDYNHRIPLYRVSHISVEQGIRIREIVFETPTGYPHPTPGYPCIPTGPSGPVGSILHPPVPFVHNLGSVYPGRMVFISGIPHPFPIRFNVNFESKPNGPDIALHCDFRFNFCAHHNVIARNTQTNNKWGPEECTDSNFPLIPNVFFEMIFLVEQHCFKVAVNNVHLLEYKHRLQPLSKFTFVRIDGDVNITQVRYQ